MSRVPALGGFSRYELQERIGIGGMAEVFRARAFDVTGNARDVVVKKILPHHGEEADFRSMFMDEARIAANLDHPNVVRVLDLGRLDGDLFLAMEYVEGSDLLRLASWLEEAGRRMPIGTALSIAMNVLAALHHAHTRVDSSGRPLGIVHRDVTPQNVLLGLDGSVKLTDFGIARAANRISQTMVGVIKGNLLYVAPEQIAGQAVDARADVYSAGILLHRLLSGRHAFEGDELPKVYQRALSGDIPPASKFNPQVPTNLDRLVQKATSLLPTGRFETADEFRVALHDFLVGKQLDAGLDALKADVRALRMGLRASPKDGRVLIADADAGASGSELRSVSVANPLFSPPSADDGPTKRIPSDPGADFVEDAPTTLQQIPTPGAAPFDLSAPTNTSPGVTSASTVAWTSTESPFGAAESPDDPTTRVPQTEAPAAPSPFAGAADADPDPTENDLPVAGVAEAARLPGVAEFSALVESAPRRAPAPPPPPPDVPPPQVRMPPPPRVATPPPWEVPPAPKNGSSAPVPAPAAPQREELKIGSTLLGPVAPAAPPAPRPAAVLVEADEGFEEHESTKPTAIPPMYAEQLGTAPAEVLEGHEQPVVALAAVREGRFVVSGSHDASVRLWDLTTRKCMFVLSGHTGPVTSVALASDGARVVSGSADQTVRVWDPETGKCTATMKGHTDWVLSLAVAPDGRTAISGGADKCVRVWDLSTGKELLALEAQPGPVTALAYLGDGTLAVSATLDGVVSLWNVIDGMTLRSFPTGVASLRALGLSRDGRRAVVGGADGQVRVWDLEKGVLAAALTGHKGPISALALTGDSARALSGSADGSARLWDLATGAVVKTFGGHGPIASVAFAIDGHAALAAAQKRVLLWDL